jgi:hypothetical protein
LGFFAVFFCKSVIKILKKISKDDIIPNCKGYQKVAQNYFLKGESNYGF